MCAINWRIISFKFGVNDFQQKKGDRRQNQKHLDKNKESIGCNTISDAQDLTYIYVFSGPL